MKYLLIACLCLITTIALPQEKSNKTYKKEFSITTDNDAYLLRFKDAYYTNGIFLKYSVAGQKKGQKILNDFELGQMIYTPLENKTQTPSDIDRPYCGYLYLKYGQTKFIDKRSVLQTTLSIGTIGDASLGKELQNSYHSLLHYSRFRGWDYQVQEALVFDASVTYGRTLLELPWLKTTPLVQANLGTTFTNAKVGAFICVGRTELNNNSALWNARINKEGVGGPQKHHELFVYFYPQLSRQIYNATIQGGLSRQSNNEVIGEPEKWMFQQNIGICFAQQRWTTRFELVWQTKEAITQIRPQQYGSLQLSYRFN